MARVPVDSDLLRSHIRSIADWPRPGVDFKDITPLLAAPSAFGAAVDAMVAAVADRGVDRVVAVEARGFLFGAPVAHALGVALVPLRKPGKLPWEIEQEEYVLEYGTDLLEMHRDGVQPGDRVVIVDDVLATGGTAAASARLVERMGGEIVAFEFLVELGFLGGREALHGFEVHALVTFEE